MVRFVLPIALAALTMLAVLSLDVRLAQVLADDPADCSKGSGETRVQACSRIIKSGRLFGKPISKKKLSIAYSNRGVAYRKKGDYDRAIADYDKAIKLNPKNASAYNNRAWAYFKWGKAAKGLPDANKAIELNPKSGTVYGTRGHIYEALDRKDEAIADFRKALELDLSNENRREALNRLGVTP